MAAQAACAEGIAAEPTVGSRQVESRVAHRNVIETIQASTISTTGGFTSVAACT